MKLVSNGTDIGGKLNLYIKYDAYDMLDKYIPNYYSLHSSDRGKNHSEFWEIYNSLHNKNTKKEILNILNRNNKLKRVLK